MTRLYINGTQADLYDDGAGISLTYSIADIQDIDKRSGAASKTITIPLTTTNRALLKYPENITSASLDQNTIHTARVEVDGVDIFKGVAKVVTVRDESPALECEIVIVGDNAEWSVKLADLDMNDIELSDLDHIIRAQIIENTWGAPANYDYSYPVVDYGGLIAKTSVDIADLRPAIKCRTLLKRIIEGQGYTINSNFLGGTFFGNLYFIGGTAAALPETWREQRLFRAGLSGNKDKTVNTGITYPDEALDLVDLSSAGYYNDTFGNFHTSGWYIVDKASIQKFTLIASTISNVQGDVVDVTYKIWKNSGGLATVMSQQIFPVGKALMNCIVSTPWMKCKAGDKIYCTVSYESQTIVANSLVTTYDTGTSFYNDVNLEYQAGNTVSMTTLMPDATQLDFIKAMKQMFNLYFWTDQDARIVYIEPRDDFFLDKSLAVDWSSKLDRDSIRITNLTPDAKFTRFTFKEDDKDANIKNYNDKYDLPFAGYKHTSSNKYTEGEGGIENGMIAGTWMEYRTNIGLSYRMPVVARDDGKQLQQFEVTPRVLYYNGLQSSAGWTFAGNLRLQYPYFSFTDFHQANDSSLSFADHDTSNGLFSKHYANTMYLQDNAKTMTGVFYLLPTDLLNIDFRKPILVDGVFYTIQQIKDYAPATGGMVEVELLKMVNKTVYQATSVTTDIEPPPYDSSKPDDPVYVPLYVEDVRVRPSTLLPVLVEDENGNLVQLYTEG